MIILLIKVIKFLNAHEKKEYKQIAINPSWLSTRKTCNLRQSKPVGIS